jgi:hypothetical protein
MGIMTDNWPQADLDDVRRLRVMAAGIPGAAVTERVFDRPLSTVWDLMWDQGRKLADLQPDMRSITILEVDGDQVSLLARSHYGFRARLHGTVRPGWCWLQSRFLLIGMAATPEPDGRTRVALTGGIRLPGRAALIPIGVRRESTKSLDHLQTMLPPS